MVNGQYNFYQNGVLLGTAKNLITTAGKDLILRYLANEVPDWGGSMSVGVGELAPTLTDTRMNFELAAAPTELKVAKVSAGQILIKTTMPRSASGLIYEAGIFSDHNSLISANPSAMLAHFDPNIKEITGTVTRIDNAGGARVGQGAAQLASAATGTVSFTIDDLYYDLSGHIASDEFAFSYFRSDTTGVSSIAVRFETNATSYYQYSFTPAASIAYQVQRFRKDAVTTTGSPNWNNIKSIQVRYTTTNVTARSITFDGLRIDDTDAYEGYHLISRAVLNNAILLDAGSPLEVEYTLSLGWS